MTDSVKTDSRIQTLTGELSFLKFTGTGSEIRVSPFTGALRSFVITELYSQWNYLLLLLPDVKAVQEAEVELSMLGYIADVFALTEFAPAMLQERIAEIARQERCIVISTYQLLHVPVPHKKALDDATVIITQGTSIGYNELLEYLNLFFYQNEQFVEEPGSYAKRGAIIDFWSYSEKMPVRIEFDGDFIESIRYFDPDSQRSVDKTERVTLAPEITGKSEETSPYAIFEYLPGAVMLYNKADAEWYLFEDEQETAADPVPVKPAADDDADIPPDFIEKPAARAGTPAITYIKQIAASGVSMHRVIEEPLDSEGRITTGFSAAPAVNSNYKILFLTIGEYISRGYTVYYAAENELQGDRVRAMFTEPMNCVDTFLETGKLKVIILPVKAGFVNAANNILLLTDYEVFNKPYRTRLPSQKKKQIRKNKQLESIKQGDFVVHEEYGIGKYLGLEAITIGEAEQECMKLRYAEGGIVYVNLNYLHLVKRYSAKDGLVPDLSTLGTADWSNKKKKAKKKIKEAARELIELYARRKMTRGHSFSADSVWQQELEASFMYEDTPDQSKVTAEVKIDMEAGNPMDRLVCGDVGFGKTEIAVRAAFKAVQEGKQAAILVPTTILAEQHYNTFSDRLRQFPVRVEVLSRFQTKARQKEIAEGLVNGTVDIVVGTHRLLSSDIGFKDLGLLIIDEEHRFGVTAKEKLRAYKLNVDILTLTATPIPRTLNLSLLGARDLSLLTTPPPNRQPVYTKVESFENAAVRKWVTNELQREGQVFVVHDRIQTIDAFADYIRRHVPEAKVVVAHGRMRPQELEDVFHNFLHKKYNVLIATKIIESGLDIPNVNTIIINRADRFGLAELHQLRGRVGRSDRQAYAYLLVPSTHSLQRNTLRRLQVIEEHSELGAGFQLAMRDLEIRGAGNLLGSEQTGFINEIGFDLYLKLINESVEELKTEEFREIFHSLPAGVQRTEASIEAYFQLGIPQAYIPDQMDRLAYYTSLFSITHYTELKEIEEDMKDKYGVLPVMVKRLISSAELRYYACYAFFERVIIQPKRILIVLPKAGNEEFYQTKFLKLVDFMNTFDKNQIQLQQQNESLKLQLNISFTIPEKAIEYLTGFAKTIAELFGLPKQIDSMDM